MIGPLTVDQKMVHWFPITPTHAMPIHKGITSPPQVISNEYFPQRRHPNKKRKPTRRPWPPNPFPREGDNWMPSQHTIKRPNVKLHNLLQLPPHPVPTLNRRNVRLYEGRPPLIPYPNHLNNARTSHPNSIPLPVASLS